jgi:hypothetical protein
MQWILYWLGFLREKWQVLYLLILDGKKVIYMFQTLKLR